MQRCKKEEIVQQLKKMLKFRHERCAKLEENARDLKREIQAIKAAGEKKTSTRLMCMRVFIVPCLADRLWQRACLCCPCLCSCECISVPVCVCICVYLCVSAFAAPA